MSTEDTLLLPMAQQRGWGERSAVGPTTRDGTPPLAYGGGFAAVYRQQQPGAVVPWPDVCALIDMAEEALHAKSLKIEVLEATSTAPPIRCSRPGVNSYDVAFACVAGAGQP